MLSNDDNTVLCFRFHVAVTVSRICNRSSDIYARFDYCNPLYYNLPVVANRFRTLFHVPWLELVNFLMLCLSQISALASD